MTSMCPDQSIKTALSQKEIDWRRLDRLTLDPKTGSDAGRSIFIDPWIPAVCHEIPAPEKSGLFIRPRLGIIAHARPLDINAHRLECFQAGPKICGRGLVMSASIVD